MRRAKYGARLVAALGDVRANVEDERAWRRFYAAARDDYGRLAASLTRRWSLPAAVEVEDVVSEMFLATPRFVRDWDPGREGARPLVDYVVFNVVDKATKWIHRQRRAGDGKSRSRHDLSFSSIARADDRAIESSPEDRLVTGELAGELQQAEARLEGRAFYRALRERLNGPDMRLFDRAMARLLDLDEAAAIMYSEDPAECLRMRAGSGDDVRRAMARVVNFALETAEGDL